MELNSIFFRIYCKMEVGNAKLKVAIQLLIISKPLQHIGITSPVFVDFHV